VSTLDTEDAIVAELTRRLASDSSSGSIGFRPWQHDRLIHPSGDDWSQTQRAMLTTEWSRDDGGFDQSVKWLVKNDRFVDAQALIEKVIIQHGARSRGEEAVRSNTLGVACDRLKRLLVERLRNRCQDLSQELTRLRARKLRNELAAPSFEQRAYRLWKELEEILEALDGACAPPEVEDSSGIELGDLALRAEEAVGEIAHLKRSLEETENAVKKKLEILATQEKATVRAQVRQLCGLGNLRLARLVLQSPPVAKEDSLDVIPSADRKIEFDFHQRFPHGQAVHDAEQIERFLKDHPHALPHDRDRDGPLTKGLARILSLGNDEEIGAEDAAIFVFNLPRFLGLDAVETVKLETTDLLYIVRSSARPLVAIAPHLTDEKSGELAIVIPKSREALLELEKSDWRKYRDSLEQLVQGGTISIPGALLICPYYLLHPPAFACLSQRIFFPLFTTAPDKRARMVTQKLMANQKLPALAEWLDGAGGATPGRGGNSEVREMRREWRLSRLLGGEPTDWRMRLSDTELRAVVRRIASTLGIRLATSPSGGAGSDMLAVEIVIHYAAGLPLNASAILAAAMREARGTERIAYVDDATRALGAQDGGLSRQLIRRMLVPANLDQAAAAALVENLIMHAETLPDGMSFLPGTPAELRSMLGNAITARSDTENILGRLEQIGILGTSMVDGRTVYYLEQRNGLLPLLAEMDQGSLRAQHEATAPEDELRLVASDL
jgi:hypothetical protein